MGRTGRRFVSVWLDSKDACAHSWILTSSRFSQKSYWKYTRGGWWCDRAVAVTTQKNNVNWIASLSTLAAMGRRQRPRYVLVPHGVTHRCWPSNGCVRYMYVHVDVIHSTMDKRVLHFLEWGKIFTSRYLRKCVTTK